LFEEHNLKEPIVDRVISSNNSRKNDLAQRIVNLVSGNSSQIISSIIICCYGAAFKNNTDDIRESPAIDIIEKLLSLGFFIKLYDPEAIENTMKYLENYSNISYHNNAYDAAIDADAIVILTEWEEFRNIDYQKLKAPIVIDYRNLLEDSKINANTKYYRLGI
jgi:UDPglucose 6-dehydrogenase